MALTDLLGKASGVFGGMGGGGQFGDDAGGATSGVTGATYTSGGLQLGSKNIGSGSATTAQAAGGGTGPLNNSAATTPPAWVMWLIVGLVLLVTLYALLMRKK